MLLGTPLGHNGTLDRPDALQNVFSPRFAKRPRHFADALVGAAGLHVDERGLFERIRAGTLRPVCLALASMVSQIIVVGNLYKSHRQRRKRTVPMLGSAMSHELRSLPADWPYPDGWGLCFHGGRQPVWTAFHDQIGRRFSLPWVFNCIERSLPHDW